MKSKKPSGSSSRTSRRRFTKSVAASIVAAPLVAGMARALDDGVKERGASPTKQSEETAGKPPTLAEAYMEVARARFGERLSPEQLEQVKKDLEDNLRSSERLRTVKLKNEDEPDVLFSVD